MSRELVVIKHCDMDKTADADETIEITFDGVKYEIDLSAAWADKLRADIAPYLEAAFSKKPIKTPTPGSARAERDENRRIRAWARDRKIKVARTGQIPEDVRRGYFEEQTLIAKATKRAAAQAKPLPANGDGDHTTRFDPAARARELAVPDPEVRADMRAFAAAQGRHLGRGFIPGDVQQAYWAAKAEPAEASA